MPNILVVYASSHGTTERIASRIATRLRSHGHHVDLKNARDGVIVLAGYDAVIVGSRVHGGRHAGCIRRFVEQHRDALLERRCAFFSVSMAVAGGGDDPALRQFLRRTHWRPAIAVSLAGALPYTRYNPLLRLIMKHISRKAGQATDTTRDHDYTDWGAVTAFADDIDRHLAPAIGPYPTLEPPPAAPYVTIAG